MTEGAKDLEGSVARLRCGDEQGSACLVSADLAIATRHSVLPHILDATVRIELTFASGESCDAVVLDTSHLPLEDVVILRTSSQPRGVTIASLRASHLPRG